MILRFFLLFMLFSTPLSAQNVNDLHTLTDEDWLRMSTEERLSALNASNNYARNQSFLGRFNPNETKYRRWGTDYYEMKDDYENYGTRFFEREELLDWRREKWSYNQFGERIDKLTHIANLWREYYDDAGTVQITQPGDYVFRRDYSAAWVGSESTSDWAISVVGGERIPLSFTPLTLSKISSGMTINFKSHNYEARLFRSGYQAPLKSTSSSSLTTGLQIRRHFGALDIGSTFVNWRHFHPYRIDGRSWKGTARDYDGTPLMFMIRVVDDSPWNGGGPVVHKIRLKVNGQYRDDLLPRVIIDHITQERGTAIHSISKDPWKWSYLNSQYNYWDHNITAWIDRPGNANRPKNVDFLYYEDWLRGWNTGSLTKYYDTDKSQAFYRFVDPGDKPLQVNGTECVIYWFDLASFTKRIERLEAEITIANDYRIQVSKISPAKSREHDSQGDNFFYYRFDRWETKAIADGNIQDGSNLRTLTVEINNMTALMTYGMDAKFSYCGFHVRGEYVRHRKYYMFSDGYAGENRIEEGVRTLDNSPRTGHLSFTQDAAWYLTARKDWERFGFAAEVFRIGKLLDPGWYGISLIQDNDDKDRFPDSRDIDGVFPGQDLDNDGYPDHDKNWNRQPDYYEPFLMLSENPTEFAYGDDFNNNSVPDYREDDYKIDTPYDIDRKGYHVNLRWSPRNFMSVVTGRLRSSGIGVANRTDSDYLKLTADYNHSAVGSLHGEYRSERIRDNIHDEHMNPRFDIRAYRNYWYSFAIHNIEENIEPDLLEYRNSQVDRVYVESRMRPLSAVTVETSVKYIRNRQVGGTMYDQTYQEGNVLRTVAAANTFIFTKQAGNIVFSPAYKYLFYKKDRSCHIEPQVYYIMSIPVVTVKYIFSPNTNLTFGMQGFRWLPFRYIDNADPWNKFRQWNWSIQFQNRSEYFGFQCYGIWGFRFEQVSHNRWRRFEDYKSSSFFTQIVMGYK